MGGNANEIFKSFQLTEEDQVYETVKQRFETHFVGRTNVNFESPWFNKRVQGAQESVIAFIESRWHTKWLVRRHGRCSKVRWQNSHMCWSRKTKWDCSTRDIPSTKDWEPIGPNQWIKVLQQIGLQLWILASTNRSRFPLVNDIRNTILQILFQSNAIRDKVRAWTLPKDDEPNIRGIWRLYLHYWRHAHPWENPRGTRL